MVSPEGKLRATDIERQLLAAGADPATLQARWGVVLWGIKQKEGRIKLKVDAAGSVDVHALERWFAELLGQPVSVKVSSSNSCCESPCKGCLWADLAKRAFWSAGLCPTKILSD